MLVEEIRVLIADDNELARNLVRSIVRQVGFRHFHVVEGGVEALSKIVNHQIGFVICDWNMPDLQGIEVLRAVREDHGLKTLPFIMVTAELTRKHVTQAIGLGVNDYVAKPFTAEILNGKVRDLLLRAYPDIVFPNISD
jgi:two-component system, chemotaxis family, chemotaxis protein CheY